MSDDSKYHLAYALSPLPRGSWIRVLVLDPGEFADPITCTLQLHKMDHPNSGDNLTSPKISIDF
jgi:hypothetical protein